MTTEAMKDYFSRDQTYWWQFKNGIINEREYRQKMKESDEQYLKEGEK